MNLLLTAFFEKLKNVHTLTMQAKIENDWRGFAQVFVTSPKKSTIIFHEKGEWTNSNLSFTNSLRWTLHSKGLSLEHLRFGANFPVPLVELSLTTENCLVSMDPHLCGQDTYSARVDWNDEGIHLYWNIQGPLKNGEIYSYYN